MQRIRIPSFPPTLFFVDSVSYLPLPKREWEMTPAAFSKLMAILNADYEKAGEEYERIRKKLIIYFEGRKCAPADEYADEVINRVARKIDEGEEVREPRRYFFGVAKYLRLEILRQPQSSGEESDERVQPASPPDDEDDTETRLGFLDQCLAKMPADNREMVIKYYEGDGRERIDNREALAKKYGLSINALKIRVCRLRDKLEACINECMGRLAKSS